MRRRVSRATRTLAFRAARTKKSKAASTPADAMNAASVLSGWAWLRPRSATWRVLQDDIPPVEDVAEEG